MRSLLFALSGLCASAFALSGQCGSSPGTAGKAISGPKFASNPANTASECCERCDRAGNACIAWSFSAGLCSMFDSFNPDAVHPEDGAEFGQLRKSTTVFDPSPQTAPQGARPVLMIIADDMRPSLPMYGLKEGYAPNLGRLAETGTMWRHAYVQYSYCAPSRQSFMSGRRPDATKSYSFEDHFREFDVGNQWLSLPQAFKARGYNTFGAGKLFHEGVPPNFDLPYSWSTPDYVDKSGNASNMCKDTCCGVPESEQSIWCMYDLKNGTLLPDMLSTDVVVQGIRSAAEEYKQTGKPFFAGLGLHKPHLSWDFPQEFLAHIPENVSNAKYDAWPNDIPHLHWHECAEMSVGGMWNSEGWGVPPPSKEYQMHARRAYYAAIAYADSLIGQALDELEAVGLADVTTVAFMADHGWSVYEADVTCKMTPDERGTRVPFIIRDPTIPASHGQVVDTIAEAVDLMPTLYELAVGEPLTGPGSENLGGLSLKPVMNDPSGPGVKDVALTQFSRCWQNTSSLGYDDTRGGPGDENNHTASWESMSDCHWVHRDAIDYMAYSIRTSGAELGEWRYTEWVEWNGTALAPNWDKVVGRELFNHTGDDGMVWVYDDFERGEYVNLVTTPSLAAKVSALSARLHTEVARWITPNPLPAPYQPANGIADGTSELPTSV